MSAEPPDIATLATPPIVGETYMVPCIEYMDGESDGVQVWTLYPVLGAIPHEDSKFGFGHEMHYHVDTRFTEYPYRFLTVLFGSKTKGEVVVSPRQCFRNQMALPPVSSIFFPMYKAHRRLKMTSSMACPHKGTCLKSMPCDSNGVVTCPAHGLSWHRQSGANAPRDGWEALLSKHNGFDTKKLDKKYPVQQEEGQYRARYSLSASQGISEDELFDRKYGNPYGQRT